MLQYLTCVEVKVCKYLFHFALLKKFNCAFAYHLYFGFSSIFLWKMYFYGFAFASCTLSFLHGWLIFPTCLRDGWQWVIVKGAHVSRSPQAGWRVDLGSLVGAQLWKIYCWLSDWQANKQNMEDASSRLLSVSRHRCNSRGWLHE